MKILLSAVAMLLFFGMNAAYADEGHSTGFPAWTYWAEVVEHAAMVLVAVGAIAYLLALRKKADGKLKSNIHTMISGLALLALSQILTNLHHLLIYPFGVWNAIVHHGLLLAAVVVMIWAYMDLLKARMNA